MCVTATFEEIVARWPRLDVLSPNERTWLLSSLTLLRDAGAAPLVRKFVTPSSEVHSRDSVQDRGQLRDLLAEIRTAVDLAENGFRLACEVPGQDAKTVDFLATSSSARVWVEVKNFNLDEVDHNIMASLHGQSGMRTCFSRKKDDVRIGRYVRDAMDKMPDTREPKVMLLFVQDLSEYLEDAEIHLFGRTCAACVRRDAGGRSMEGPPFRDDSGYWSARDDTALSGVIVAGPTGDWRLCGPMGKVLLVNPACNAEANTLLEQWPMVVRRIDDPVTS